MSRLSPTATARDRAAQQPTRADTPRLVIRGETHNENPAAPEKAAHVDWLSFTVLPPFKSNPLPWIEPFLTAVFKIPREVWEFTGHGWQGYRERVTLGAFGLLAYGGESQGDSVHVSLNAQGCALIQDWQAVRLWGETYEARIARLDLAYDDFQAETVSVDLALKWFREGGFNLNGRPARPHLRDDLGTGEGRTLYIGKRQNGKVCRVYEKGKHLGDITSPWCRVELELRNKSRLIPWEAVTRCGNYLAGAYPCLTFISIEQSKVRTLKHSFQISYDRMTHWVRTAAGPALNVMCEVHGGDAAGVLFEVVRDGRPKRLAGLPTSP